MNTDGLLPNALFLTHFNSELSRRLSTTNEMGKLWDKHHLTTLLNHPFSNSKLVWKAQLSRSLSTRFTQVEMCYKRSCPCCEHDCPCYEQDHPCCVCNVPVVSITPLHLCFECDAPFTSLLHVSTPNNAHTLPFILWLPSNVWKAKQVSEQAKQMSLLRPKLTSRNS